MIFTNSGFPCLKICPAKKSRQLHLVAGTSGASCLKAMGLEASLMSGKAGGQRCWMCFFVAFLTLEIEDKKLGLNNLGETNTTQNRVFK